MYVYLNINIKYDIYKNIINYLSNEGVEKYFYGFTRKCQIRFNH